MVETADYQAMLPHILNYAVLLGTITYFVSFSKWDPVNTFIVGLTTYRLAPPELAAEHQQREALQEDPKDSKKAKKRYEALVKLNKGNSKVPVLAINMRRAECERFQFMEEFKHLGTLLAAITVIVLVTLAITAAMPSQQWNLITILSVLAVLYVLAMAYQSEWEHVVNTKEDKLYRALIGLCAAISTGLYLLKAPPAWRVVDVYAAGSRVTATLKARLQASDGKQAFSEELWGELEGVGPALLAALMSVVAAAVSGLILQPAIRQGRLLQQVLQAPIWCQVGNMQQPGWVAAAAGTQYLLPLCLIVLGLPSMCEVLLLPDAVVPLLRWALACCLVVVSTTLQRPLVQTWLNQNFFNYWRLRHLHNRDIDDELRLQLMDRAERTCLTQIARVAMQVAFLPAMILSWLYLMTLRCLPTMVVDLTSAWQQPTGSSSSGSSGSSGSGDVEDQGLILLYQTLSGFAIWWICVAWWTSTTLGMLMERLSTTSTLSQ